MPVVNASKLFEINSRWKTTPIINTEAHSYGHRQTVQKNMMMPPMMDACRGKILFELDDDKSFIPA